MKRIWWPFCLLMESRRIMGSQGPGRVAAPLCHVARRREESSRALAVTLGKHRRPRKLDQPSARVMWLTPEGRGEVVDSHGRIKPDAAAEAAHDATRDDRLRQCSAA